MTSAEARIRAKYRGLQGDMPPFGDVLTLLAVLDSERFLMREKVAALMLRCSVATGHGDTVDDLLGELEAGIMRLVERV